MKIRIPYMLRHLTGGVETVEVKGQTVGECLSALGEKLPGIEAHLFDENGQLFKHFILFVNNRNISHLDSMVNDEDELLILVAIDGG